MDIVGPLPRTHRGNRYILIVVYHFIKHAEAYALPDQEAITIVRVFLNEFISRLGIPYINYTDRVANIESNMFKELFQLLNIKKTCTSPYYLKCNNQLEIIHCMLIELLAFDVANPTKNWDLNLSIVLIAYRWAVQSSPGLAPHFMLFGCEMRSPLDSMYRLPKRS